MAVTHNERLHGLYRQHSETQEEASRYLAKADASADEQQKGLDAINKMKAIKVDIERELQAEEGRSLLAEHKTWREDPVHNVPFSAGGKYTDKAADASKSFDFLGFEKAGHSKVDVENRRILEEVGPGTFSKKKWEAMLSDEYRLAYTAYLKGGQHILDRSKILQEGLDDQGGVFAPAEMIMRVIGRLPAPTMLRSMVTQLTTGRDMVTMPRKQYSADDKYTTAFRATWTGEIPSSEGVHAVDDTNLLGEVSIPVHTAMLSAPVTNNMMEDSAFPFQSWLESELNQVIDLLYEDMIANGTGVGQPAGFLSNPGNAHRPEVIVSGTSAAFDQDNLTDVQTAVAPQYEGNANWVMNKKSTYRYLRKLKDLQDRPLFTEGYSDSGLVLARQKVLLGDPVRLCQFMPDIGASTYPIAYGDFKGYYLVNRLGFSIQVLRETRAKLNQIELVGRVRFGGLPVEHWRMKLLKLAAS
jgi:HK97 family phage major capsid protein